MAVIGMKSDGTIIRHVPLGFWAPQREWEGETVFIVGGGQSLKGFDAEVLRGKRVIAVNEAGLSLTPWADVLFFADKQWHEWNAHRLDLFQGTHIVTRCRNRLKNAEHIKRVKFIRDEALARLPWQVSGWCGGGSSINLAVHFGAKRIVLLGFDMYGFNFHDMHKGYGPLTRYEEQFIPAIERMVPRLKALGVEVMNATPNSKLTCFPSVSLTDVLQD